MISYWIVGVQGRLHVQMNKEKTKNKKKNYISIVKVLNTLK
jgi:hypothetical protein